MAEYPLWDKANLYNLSRGDKVRFRHRIHTVVYVDQTKGGGAGMAEYPGYTTVVFHSGLVLMCDDWSHKTSIRQNPFSDAERRDFEI